MESEQNQTTQKPQAESVRGKTFFRGGRGGRRGGRKPSNKPVTEQQAVATATRLPVKQPTPITSNDPFKPKNTGHTPSVMKNDPYFNMDIITSGFDMAPYNQTRHFEIDFSGYQALINGSYQALTEFDRGLRKYVSASMYSYYCIIGLWHRLLKVFSGTTGEFFLEFNQLSLNLPEMGFSREIALFLDGIGNINDNDNVKVDLHLQHQLVDQPRNGGAAGSFGRVSGATHNFYETLPAPIVSLIRMQADYLYTQGGNREWDLPANLTPAAADNVHQPTENLLGWKLANKLTQEQLQILEGCGMTLDAANLDFAVINIAGIPINRELIMTISNYLASSKSPNTNKTTDAITGSMAQLPYKVRDPNDHNIDRKLITEKSSSLNCVTQILSTVSYASTVFQFRIDRQFNDTYCYTIAQGQNYLPAWVATKNDVFNFGYTHQNWNRKRYSSGYSNGLTNVGAMCRFYRTNTKPS